MQNSASYINGKIVDPNRRVGEESSKTFKEKLASGFFEKYMSGKVCELGYSGYLKDILPILPDADGYDKATPGYNGLNIPVADGHYDSLYSSHTLEHISDYKSTLKEWFRVVKDNGYMVLVLPHQFLYEKREVGKSKFNGDHKRMYTAASLLKEIEESLETNSYRVRHLRENDEGHVYTDKPDVHGKGMYEVEVVIQKLPEQCWWKNNK